MRRLRSRRASNPLIPASTHASLLPFVFLLAWALFVFSPLVADPDLWGHVRFGQDMVRTGQIVRADTYSYLTAGQPWINHEWLTEAIDALAYGAAGPAGLIALNLLLSLLIVSLIYRKLTRAGTGTTRALLLTAGICLVLRPAVLNVRPQVFTYLLFLALLLLLDACMQHTDFPYQKHQGRRLWFAAGVWLLLAVWVNLHGGVLAGMAVLYLWGLAYLAEAMIHSRSARVLAQPLHLPVVALLVLAPTALLANPYGAGLVTFLLRTATVGRPEIVEWQGVRLNDLWSLDWLATAVLTLVAVSLSRRPRRAPLLVPLAAVALLPLFAVRHIPLLAVAAPVLAADHFADLSDRLLRALSLSRLSRVRSWVSAPVFRWLLLAGAVVLLGLSAPRLQGIVIQPASANFPVRAVEVLQAAAVSGNMATEFNWGEYVIWHLGPKVQVSIDGRRETVYSEAVYRENLDFMRGAGQWDRLVDRPETDLALVDHDRPAYHLMLSKPGWRLVYEDSAAALFVRSNGRWPDDVVDPPASPPDGAGLAFPVE